VRAARISHAPKRGRFAGASKAGLGAGRTRLTRIVDSMRVAMARGSRQRTARMRRSGPGEGNQPTMRTACAAMRSFHSAGPVWCTEVPSASTATVTGMSRTSNS